MRMKHFGIMAGIAIALASSSNIASHYFGKSESDIERIFFRTYGPGRNQRKRRKLARQSPNSSKWQRRK